jgi:hypothetical protein
MYNTLSPSELVELNLNIPSILNFSLTNISDDISNDIFPSYSQLPQEIKLKIASSVDPNIFRTEKSLLQSQEGKLSYYDSFCLKGISFNELNKYVKSLPKNTKTLIGCLFLLRSTNYYLNSCSIEIELLQNDKLNIYQHKGQKIKTLITSTSFIDYLIQLFVSNDGNLVTVVFDPITIKNIVSLRKTCMNINNNYIKDYTKIYVTEVINWLKDYFGPMSEYISISLAQLNSSLPNDLSANQIRRRFGINTFLFASTNSIPERNLEVYSEYILKNI